MRNRCARERIAAPYRALLTAALTAYREAIPSGLLDVRLQGSVARGEATPGRSDLDLMGLLAADPPDEAVQSLQAAAAALRARWPIFSRVELDLAELTDLTPFQRFVLSSDSLSLHGVDTVTQPVQHLPRWELAALVTPPMPEMIREYAEWATELATAKAAEAPFASRIFGKDLLKGIRQIALLRGAPYTVSPAEMRQQAVTYVPELAPLATALLALYDAPPQDAAVTLAAVQLAATDLLPLLP